MATTMPRSFGVSEPAAEPLRAILEEISVPMDVITEARRRRDLVLDIGLRHPSVRGRWSSGSVAYGTANSPLEDADGGLKMNRRLADMREFGPDASGVGHGPGELMREIGHYVLERLRPHYPQATVDTSGKRAIKFEFHELVDIDAVGPVDPYVDLVLGLARADGKRGVWIPNRKAPGGWDIADPAGHLAAMNGSDDQALRTLRAHVIRLTKRAVKHDDVPVVCSWNLCALALELITDSELPMHEALAVFIEGAAEEIRYAPTPDPSPVVAPIALPANVTAERASLRLREMAGHARSACNADSSANARSSYAQLFGPEVDAIRARERPNNVAALNAGAALAAVPAAAHKSTRSYGASRAA